MLEPTESPFKTYLNENERTHHQFTFTHVSEDEVGKSIDSLKNKRTLDCYGISTELVQLCKSELIPVVTLIINQCIDRSIFPEQLKIARVSAIHKKGGKNILRIVDLSLYSQSYWKSSNEFYVDNFLIILLIINYFSLASMASDNSIPQN